MADGPEPPSEPSSAEKPKELLVFLCYRRQDGADHAAWLDRSLNGREYVAKDGSPRRIRCYYDKTAPGVADWKSFHFPSLQSSAVLVFISTPGAAKDLSEGGSPDWVQEELKWWVANRGQPPAVVDTTGDPRWIPALLRQKWKDLNRIPVVLDRVDERSKSHEPRASDEVIRQLINTFLDQEEPTVFEAVERERALTRKRTMWLTVASILAVVAAIFALIARQERRLAIREARVATSLRLAAEAVNAERADLSLLLGAQSYTLDKSSTRARHALLRSFLIAPRLITLLDARQDRVWGLSWSADGERLVSSSDDGGLVLWDFARRRRTVLAGDHADRTVDPAIWAVAFSPDGSRIAAGDDRGEVWTINPESGDRERMGELGGKVLRLAFSHDGSRLAAGARTGVTLWDLTGETPEQRPLGETGEVWGLAFERNGSRLVTAGSDEKLPLDGDWWAAQSRPGVLMVWDTETAALLWRSEKDLGHHRIATSVDFSPDGTTLVSGGEDGQILLWDSESGELLDRVETQQKSVWSVAFDPSGSFVASSSENDGRVVLWDLNAARRVADYRIGAPGSLWTVAFRPTGRTLAASIEAGEGRIALLDVGTGSAPAEPDDDADSSALTSLALRTDGGVIAAGAGDGSIRLFRPVGASALKDDVTVWNAASAASRTPAYQPFWTSSPELVPAHALSVPREKRLCALAFGSKRLIAAIAAREEETDASGRLCRGRKTPRLLSWGPASAEAEEIPIALPAPPDALAIDSRGRRLAVGIWETNLQVFDLDQASQPPLTLTIEGKRWIRSLAFSRDGKLLAAGDRFGDITVWNLEEEKARGELISGLSFEVPSLSLAFSHDDDYLAAGYENGQIGVWEVASGESLVSFSHRDDATLRQFGGGDSPAPKSPAVRALAFDVQGLLLLSGDDRGAFTVWNLDPESWLEGACRRAGRILSADEQALYLRGGPYPLACPEEPAGLDGSESLSVQGVGRR